MLFRSERAIRQSDAAQYAEVISGFDSGSDQGRVLWHGQSWAAENLEPGQALKPGSQVLVMGRDGTNLQVLPEEQQWFQGKASRLTLEP